MNILITKINRIIGSYINKEEVQYLNLLNNVLNIGEFRGDRTGVGEYSIFAPSDLVFDLSDGSIPLYTTKKINWKNPIIELLWFLKGSSNIKELKDQNVNIWNEWATADDEIGPMYGVQWRNWQSYKFIDNGPWIPCGRWGRDIAYIPILYEIDQIKELIHNLKTRPFSRRHIVSAWNPASLPDESMSPQDNVKNGKQALASCHKGFQCYVSQDLKLSMLLEIRSNDLSLGNPYNVFQYAILLRMLCEVCDLKPGKLHVKIGCAHIYSNHINGIKEQLKRIPYKFPKLKINRQITDIDDFKLEDFEIVDYKHHNFIKFPVAV